MHEPCCLPVWCQPVLIAGWHVMCEENEQRSDYKVMLEREESLSGYSLFFRVKTARNIQQLWAAACESIAERSPANPCNKRPRPDEPDVGTGQVENEDVMAGTDVTLQLRLVTERCTSLKQELDALQTEIKELRTREEYSRQRAEAVDERVREMARQNQQLLESNRSESLRSRISLQHKDMMLHEKETLLQEKNSQLVHLVTELQGAQVQLAICQQHAAQVEKDKAGLVTSRETAYLHLLLAWARQNSTGPPNVGLQQSVNLVRQPDVLVGGDVKRMNVVLTWFMKRQQAARELIAHLHTNVLSPLSCPSDVARTIACKVVYSCMHTGGLSWDAYKERAASMADKHFQKSAKGLLCRFEEPGVFPEDLKDTCLQVLDACCSLRCCARH